MNASAVVSPRAAMRGLWTLAASIILMGCGGGSGGAPPISSRPPPPPPPPENPPPPSPADFAVRGRVLDFVSEFGDVASAPSRGRLYGSLTERNELIVLAADTYVEIERLHVGPQPGVMALSSDEAQLYVALSFGGGIAIVDLATHSVRRVDVASAVGSVWITALIEVRPGLLLVGGSSTRHLTRLVSVDLNHGDAKAIVADGQEMGNTDDFALSADRRFLYVADNGLREPPQYFFKLDATRDDLPLLGGAEVGTFNQSIAVSPDGLRLINGGGVVYSTADFRRLETGWLDGVIASSRDGMSLVQAPSSGELRRLDVVAPGSKSLHPTDCPGRLLRALYSSEVRDEWLLNLAGQLCVVSFSRPGDPPAIDADRTLPPYRSEPIPVPWAEIPIAGGSELVLDEARGLAYVPVPLEHRVAVVSLDELNVIDSIALAGQVGRAFLSRDGNSLYVGLVDQGVIAEIDLESREVIRSTVNLTEFLGRPAVGDIVELEPGQLIVGAQSPFADPSWVVEVSMDSGTAARRIGCSEGYGGTTLFTSPDRRYLYIATNSLRCPLLEQRDMTTGDFTLVRTSDPGNENNLGRHAFSGDGRFILGQGGEVISVDTLWSTGHIGAGPASPVASRDPDRYYMMNGSIAVARISDYSLTAIVSPGCPSLQGLDGVSRAIVTEDEQYALQMVQGKALCIAELPADP